MANLERIALQASASSISVAAHVFALVASILLFVWTINFRGGLSLYSDNADLIINAHAVIMFVGFILVAGEAIMVYNMIRTVHKVQKAVHMFFQLFAISMAIFGIDSAFKFHNQSEIPNMYSLHSWLGIITICLFGLQWVLGFFFFWFPMASLPTRPTMAQWHAFMGLVSFLMAICTSQTGLAQKGVVGSGTESRLINFTAIFILLFAFAVCLAIVLPRIIMQA